MLQRLVSAVSYDGSFVALSGVSRAAAQAGITVPDVLGKKLWDYSDGEKRDEIRTHFAAVLFDGVSREYQTESVIDGVAEHWHVRLERVLSPAHVLCVGVEIPPAIPRLSTADIAVLRLMSSDASIKEMAAALRVTRSAVDSRISALRERFEVQTSYGLMAKAARVGLLRFT